MGETYEFSPDYVTHPGETVREKLADLGMSQKEFAVRTGKPQKTISAILNGRSAILPETAVQFEKVLNIPANYWLSHQILFDEFKARQKRKKSLDSADRWTREFPYAEMAKRGLVKPTRKIREKTEELLSFFNVYSDKAWEEIYLNKKLPLLFRQALKTEKNPHAVSVLLRIAEIEASKMEVRPYNRQSFENALPMLKSIMRDKSDDQLKKIAEICARTGVKFIFTAYIPQTNIYGVVRWINNWPVILLTDRKKRYDIFWFSLFHEFGHILLHEDKKNIFLDSAEDKKGGRAEAQADDFASEWLLSQSEYEELRSLINFDESKEQIVQKINIFAEKFDLPSDIIIGRVLHHKPELYKKGLVKAIAEMRF